MTLHQVLAVCRIAVQVDPGDVQALLDQFEREDTLGPIITPTEWTRTHRKASNARKAMEAFARLRKELAGVEIDEASRLAGDVALASRGQDARGTQGRDALATPAPPPGPCAVAYTGPAPSEGELEETIKRDALGNPDPFEPE